MELSTDVLMDLHRRMVRIRLFEEAAGKLAEAAKLPGFLHLYVGQEAVASGVCATLTDDDQITSTHRGHGHLVAKGGQFNEMMAELMAKSTGYCKGKGGSMHISNLDVGMLGANGIVGAGSTDRRRRGLRQQVQGRTATWPLPSSVTAPPTSAPSTRRRTWPARCSLPVLFACENNEYGEFTARETRRWRSPTSSTAPPATACRASSSTGWTSSRSTRPRSRPSPGLAEAKGRR